MPIFFNSLLAQHGLAPATVILLRHQDKQAAPGRTPYDLWRDNRPAFEIYQACQSFENRSKFSRVSNWASLVARDACRSHPAVHARQHAALPPWSSSCMYTDLLACIHVYKPACSPESGPARKRARWLDRWRACHCAELPTASGARA
jgi:hypothetical protein